MVTVTNQIKLGEDQAAKIVDGLKVNRFTVFMLVVASLGFLLDSYDTSLVSYLMPSIAKEWRLSPVAIGFIASTAVWGTVLGQYVWGPIGDLFGRKKAFQGTVLSFGLLTGLATFAWNPMSLATLRFLAGTGLGGFIPLDAVMIMEMAPTRIRGRMVSILPILFPAGQLVAVSTTLFLLPVIGWRGMFVVGAVPAILAWIARLRIPETPRWLALKNRHEETVKSLKLLGATDEQIVAVAQSNQSAADEVAATAQNSGKVSLGSRAVELFSRKYLGRNVLTWGIWICLNFGYFGFMLWLPSILVTLFKFTLIKSLSYTVIIAAVGTLGRVTGHLLIDRIGRKALIIYTFSLVGVVSLIFGAVSSQSMLLLFACLFFFFADQGSVGVVTYVPELFPTHLRSLGSSWAAAPGRLAAALAPMILGALIAVQSYYTIWIIFAILYWIGALLTFFLGVETKNRALEEV